LAVLDGELAVPCNL